MKTTLALLALTAWASAAAADCIIYQHRDFGGSQWRLLPNDRLRMVAGEDLGQITSHCPSCSARILHQPSWNDHVSSVRVDPGCTLTMWQHIDEGGAVFRTGQSYIYVGDRWNDEVSEALCTCR